MTDRTGGARETLLLELDALLADLEAQAEQLPADRQEQHELLTMFRLVLATTIPHLHPESEQPCQQSLPELSTELRRAYRNMVDYLVPCMAVRVRQEADPARRAGKLERERTLQEMSRRLGALLDVYQIPRGRQPGDVPLYWEEEQRQLDALLPELKELVGELEQLAMAGGGGAFAYSAQARLLRWLLKQADEQGPNLAWDEVDQHLRRFYRALVEWQIPATEVDAVGAPAGGPVPEKLAALQDVQRRLGNMLARHHIEREKQPHDEPQPWEMDVAAGVEGLN